MPIFKGINLYCMVTLISDGIGLGSQTNYTYDHNNNTPH